MKTALYLAPLVLNTVASQHTDSIIDVLALKLCKKQDQTYIVSQEVAALLRNEGLCTDHQGPITLKDAVKETQRSWLNEQRKPAATGNIVPHDRVAIGTQLLETLHQTDINAPAPADTIIAHAGVLPSVAKTLLAAKMLYESAESPQWMIVVTSNEPLDHAAVRKTMGTHYSQAARILTSIGIMPEYTRKTRPKNQRAVFNGVLAAFTDAMPELNVRFVDKKDLVLFATQALQPLRLAVAAPYAQLEADIFTFAALKQHNPNWEVVSGMTAGPQPLWEDLYDAQSPEEKYNFERNNFARILHCLAEHYHVQ